MERDYSLEYRAAAEEYAKRVQTELADSLHSVTLFGSVATGHADPDSDIDVLVVLKNDRPQKTMKVYDVALDIQLQYNVPLAVKVFTQTRWENLSELGTSFIKDIQKHGVLLWGTKLQTK